MNTWLLRIALLATLILTASAEYLFAVRVGWHPYVAWAMAVSLDIYVIAALRAKRDVSAAVGLMVVTNVAAHSVEMIPGLTVDGRPVWWLLAAASALPPVVLWRIHRLAGHGDQAADQVDQRVVTSLVTEVDQSPAVDQPVGGILTSDQAPELRVDQESDQRDQPVGHADQVDQADMSADIRPDTEADIRPDTEADIRPDTEADIRPDIEADIGRTRSRTTARTSGRTSKPDTGAAVARLAARHPDWSSAQIARRLGVTDRTVRRHLSSGHPASLRVVGGDR